MHGDRMGTEAMAYLRHVEAKDKLVRHGAKSIAGRNIEDNDVVSNLLSRSCLDSVIACIYHTSV